MPQTDHDVFWALIDELQMEDPRVEEGTIMGGRCARVAGEFLGLVDFKGSGLVVKLPRDRVDERQYQGTGDRRVGGEQPERRRDGEDVQRVASEPLLFVLAGEAVEDSEVDAARQSQRFEHECDGAPGEKVNLIIRGKAQPAEIVALPFVQQNYKR